MTTVSYARPANRPTVEIQERRRSNAAGPHRGLRGQRRGRGAVQSAAIIANLMEWAD